MIERVHCKVVQVGGMVVHRYLKKKRKRKKLRKFIGHRRSGESSVKGMQVASCGCHSLESIRSFNLCSFARPFPRFQRKNPDNPRSQDGSSTPLQIS